MLIHYVNEAWIGSGVMKCQFITSRAIHMSADIVSHVSKLVGSYLELLTCRSQEKQDAENSATREPGSLNMFGKFKQYASSRISSFRTPRPNGG